MPAADQDRSWFNPSTRDGAAVSPTTWSRAELDAVTHGWEPIPEQGPVASPHCGFAWTPAWLESLDLTLLCTREPGHTGECVATGRVTENGSAPVVARLSRPDSSSAPPPSQAGTGRKIRSSAVPPLPGSQWPAGDDRNRTAVVTGVPDEP